MNRMNYLVEILVEEPSMANVLTHILPKILPEGYELNKNCSIRVFDGKQDLQKHIPIKAKAYRNFPQPVKLIIIQDKDSNDCVLLKQHLRQLITSNNPNIPYLIRIACTELESWYIGDMAAIEKIYPKFKAASHINKAKFRNPDKCNAFDEIRQLIPSFQKGYASKNIPIYFNIESNTSLSFQHLISGIQRFLSE